MKNINSTLANLLKYRFLSIVTFFAFFSSSCLAQSFDWIRHGGSNMDGAASSGGNNEKVEHMTTDNNGNVYILTIVGRMGTLYIDGSVITSGYGGISPDHVLFASYSCNGTLRFAKYISGSEIYPQGIIADSFGHVYLALGVHYSTGAYAFHLDSDTMLSAFSSAGYGKEMLAQYDTIGQFNWMRFVGVGSTPIMGLGGRDYNYVTLGEFGEPHLICMSRRGVLFETGDTSSYGFTDLNYDSLGNLISSKHILIDSTFVINSVSIEKGTDKMFITGSRARNFIDPPYDSSDHNFIALLDSNRSLIWLDTVAHPSSSTGYDGLVRNIVTDHMGNVYVIFGVYGDAVYRGDTMSNVFGGGHFTTVVMKLDTLGSRQWHRIYSCSYNASLLNGLMLIDNRKLAICGTIMGGMIVGGSDTMSVYAGEGHNPIFSILDTSGNVHSIQQVHGVGFHDFAYSLTADRVGSIYVGCQMQNNAWAAPLAPVLSGGGYSDFFLLKYGVDCGCTTMPTASFTETGTITRIFTYTGTTTPAIDSVRWYFGDGSTSTLLSPTHTYTTADTFDVCMRVYTACGTDLYCKTIIIPCVAAPSAPFAMSGTGLTRTFTYTGATTGLTGPVTWTFTGGTGPTSGSPVSHVFPAAGPYTVCVTATNACGSTTTCNPVTITCTSSPVSSFTSSGSGLTKFFIYTGTTAGMDSVTWTFGDGGVATGTTPSHTYAIPGTYTVCAKVWTNCGVHTACSSVVVTCATTPTASFTYAVTGGAVSFTYTGTTTPAIDSIRWDFGDGGTSTSASPSHTYVTEDTFHVCVTVYTMCGNNTSCQDVIVTCFLPVTAAFTDTGMLVHGFAYTGTMAGYDSVVWTFGDGGTDTGLNVIYTYAVADTYYVCANVFTDCGTHTICRNIIIGTVGIAGASLAAISVYPNPSRNELMVANVPKQMDYRIVNVVSVVMQQGALIPGGNTLPIDALPVGTYLLEMSGADGSRKVARFVKM